MDPFILAAVKVAQHGSWRFLLSHWKPSSYTLANNVNMISTEQNNDCIL
jgi:hypothetical protein